ncbi:Uncharacterized protein GBIM_06506 [Gryllus bimaculatus]|nr:Uncharacterized protein GBIM_06506 [Gryllus bimaculatus]
MVSYPQTGMKIPVRPAPAPPSSRPNRTFQRSSSFFDGWDDGNDPFSNGNISRSFSAQHIGPAPAVKKKPPPRPPPPKINNHQPHNSKQNKSNVLSGLFSRSNQRTLSSSTTMQKQVVTRDHNVVIASLIDFDSPSSSPTFTTRSSSDGVSVNSFGSDGSASNNGNTPSGGTASLFESGFEDDFDFFGGLSNNQVKTPISDQKDPWSVSPQDPFSPPRAQESVSNAANTTWFNDSPGNEINKASSVGALKPPPVTSVMPTIIRAKPNRPSAPPKPTQIKDAIKPANQGPLQNMLSLNNNTSVFDSSKPFSYTSENEKRDHSREWSPPMPSVPPPPPPENVNSEIDFPISLPDLPPRKPQVSNKKMPHGVALYDYETNHPDDLAFKCNDVIHILKKVNDEWLLGEKGNQQGMFPANFIEVIVPLEESVAANSGVQTVTALYPFPAQQWDDLNFPEGAVIQVLSQVNSDWLYGEYQGNRGQFPASFVDHVPAGLPQRKP